MNETGRGVENRRNKNDFHISFSVKQNQGMNKHRCTFRRQRGQIGKSLFFMYVYKECI